VRIQPNEQRRDEENFRRRFQTRLAAAHQDGCGDNGEGGKNHNLAVKRNYKPQADEFATKHGGFHYAFSVAEARLAI
jgi:hypothetical protein